jgi:LCP family protein required for cell wall assembly
MSQAQPHQPRQPRRRRGRRGGESRRPGADGAELQEQPPVGGRGRRVRRRSAAGGDPTTARARRSTPLLPFVLGVALGYGLAGPLPHLAGVALAGLKQGQASLGGLVNPFGLGQRQVLVLGTDAVADNTDVMFTLQVKDGITRLTQVPRDTFVESDAYGVLKANALYATGGADAAKREVGRLLNAPVGNYLKVNLRAVERLADALGGVEVDVPKRMFYVDNSQGLTIDLHPGRQLLKGAALEGFLRFRHDELGDLGRMERQKLVLREVFRKLAQPGSVARLPALLMIAGDDVRTDLSSVEMGQMLSALVGSRLSTAQLPGRVFWQNELSYWMPNTNSHYAGVESNEPAP